MPDFSAQSPQPKSSAGYRPLVPDSLSRGLGNSAVPYVAAAAGLGLAVGVAIAFNAGRANIAAAPRVSEALTTHSSGLNSLPAVYTGPAPSLLSQVETQKKPSNDSQVQSSASQNAGGKPTGAHKKHRMHKLWPWKKGSGANSTARRRPYVSPTAPVAAEQPTAQELAAAAAASGPFFLAIEGEVTVANYDVDAGTIQTYEGSNFVLDKASGASGAIPWEDFPFNVHYRCDATGNCTLVRRGATEIARLTR
jgi:hypothetical protein